MIGTSVVSRRWSGNPSSTRLRWSRPLVMGGVLSAVLLLGIQSVPGMQTQSSAPPQSAWPVDDSDTYRVGLPRVFLRNEGQWAEHIAFASAFGNAPVRAEEGAIAFLLAGTAESGDLRVQVLRLVFEGSRNGARPDGEEPQPGVFNLLLGRDESRWRRNLPGYGRLVYRNLYPGVDVALEVSVGRLEMTATPVSGRRLNPMVLRVEGLERGMLEERDGDLWIGTGAGSVRMEPKTLASINPHEHAGRLRRLDATRIVVEPLGAGDAPVAWSTYVGGSKFDTAKDAIVDERGVTIVGRTLSPEFPSTPGSFDPDFAATQAPMDGFIVRFNPVLRELVFGTFVGGISSDALLHIASAENGDLIAAGWSNSVDFPVTPNAFDITVSSVDSVVCRLTGDGSALVASTILGNDGFGVVDLKDMDVDKSGAVVVVGSTDTADYPTTPGAFLEVPPIQTETPFNAFVSQLDPTLSNLIFSTYIGGGSSDTAYGVKFLPGGSVLLVGRTRSTDYPTTLEAYDLAKNLGNDAFLTRLDPTGGHLEFSTYLGGSAIDEAHGVDLAVDGSIVVVGLTTSQDFPTTPDAFDPNPTGSMDCFVARFDSTLSDLIYSTSLSGLALEHPPFAIAAGRSGEITVVGSTRSEDFPVTPGAFQTTHGGLPTTDCWVARLHPSGRSLLYSSFLGGAGDDLVSQSEPVGLALDAYGDAVVAGDTASLDFPTTPGVFTEDNPGGGSAFVTRLSMLPTGAGKYGASTHGPQGPIAIGVGAQPSVGNRRFSITTSNGPRNTQGYLLVSRSGLSSPVSLAGTDAWLDLETLALVLLFESDELGWAEKQLPIPPAPSLAGLHAYAQTFWPLAPAGTWAASNALAITVVP